MDTMFTFECVECDRVFEDLHDRDTIRDARLDCPECSAKKSSRRIYTPVQIIDDTLPEPMHVSTLKACLPHNVAAGRPYDIVHSRSELRKVIALHPMVHNGREIVSANGT